MQTYPLEERCALFLTERAAAAILVADAHRYGPGSGLPPEVTAALDAGRTPWDVASDGALWPLLENGDWDSVADAHDLLESDDVEDMVFCSEFTGTATGSEGFGEADLNVDDGYVAMLVPQRPLDLFKAAYQSREELLDEYRRRLEGYVGHGFPYAQFVMDVSGTYIC